MHSSKKYRIIDHTADIGIEVIGKDIEELFSNSVIALFDLMSGGKSTDMEEEKSFSVEEKEKDIAAVSILEECLFLFESENFSADRCSIEKSESVYEVKLYGGRLKREELTQGVEIKAVTYHQLSIEKKEDYFSMKVIFDI